MKVDELKAFRDQLEQQHNNLSNAEWLSNQLKHISAKHELLSQLIDNLEKEETNATSPKKRQTNSNNNQGKQTI